ncbi:MAG: type IX secretion system protein PorQ [Bacteroidales bacterium]|nr:type IX secretion system protein PorQ [Bacteroidales bacterium]
MMNTLKRIVWLNVMMLCLNAQSQTGGKYIYTFLDMPVSARHAAMGSRMVSVRDHSDASLAVLNPSLLHAEMNTGLAVNCVDYFGKSVYGHANYIQHFKKAGTFNFAFQYAAYAKFDSYDETGEPAGTFTAGDYALYVGYGREFIDSTFSLGMNLKTIFSSYANYFSSGFAIDFAASYYCCSKDISLTLLLKNIGTQFNTYDGLREKLPFDIQLAFSQKFQHLPARYHIILHHLYTWNMSYKDPNDPFAPVDGATGAVIENGKGKKFANNFFSHITFALEIMPVKYISLHAAFDYNTRYQMRTYAKKGVVGLSYGLGVHFYHFNIYYGRNHNNLVSTPNYFTISTNINEFLNK